MEMIYEEDQQEFQGNQLGEERTVVTPLPPVFNTDKNRAVLLSLLNDLKAMRGDLKTIKKYSESYSTSKNRKKLVKETKAAVQSIEEKLSTSLYRSAQSLFTDYWYSPLYNFRVACGINMDQMRRFRFGTRLDAKMDEKMTVAGLRLQEIDIAGNPEKLKTIIEEDIRILDKETAKAEVYLKKLDVVDKYLEILDRRDGTHYTIKRNLLTVPVTEHQVNFIDRTKDYLHLTMDLLGEIKKQAGIRLKDMTDGNTEFKAGFSIENTIDDLDRLASYASFNGMSLLTGRFSNKYPDSPWVKPFILNSGPLTDNKTELVLDSITTHENLTKAIPFKNWEWDVEKALSTEETIENLTKEIDVKLKFLNDKVKGLDALSTKVKALDKDPSTPRLKDPIETLANKKMPKKWTAGFTWTAKPSDSPHLQAMMAYKMAEQAIDKMLEHMVKIREYAVEARNSAYTDNDRLDFTERAEKEFLAMENIIKSTTFNSVSLLDGKVLTHEIPDLQKKVTEEYTIEISVKLKNRDKSLFLPFPSLTPDSMHISRRDIQLSSIDEANRAIGMADWAMMVLQEAKNNCYSQFIYHSYENDIAATWNPLSEIPEKGKVKKVINELITKLLQVTDRAYYYLWAASSGIYTEEDRKNIYEHVLITCSALADMDIFLQVTENNIGEDELFSPVITKLKLLNESINNFFMEFEPSDTEREQAASAGIMMLNIKKQMENILNGIKAGISMEEDKSSTGAAILFSEKQDTQKDFQILKGIDLALEMTDNALKDIFTLIHQAGKDGTGKQTLSAILKKIKEKQNHIRAIHGTKSTNNYNAFDGKQFRLTLTTGETFSIHLTAYECPALNDLADGRALSDLWGIYNTMSQVTYTNRLKTGYYRNLYGIKHYFYSLNRENNSDAFKIKAKKGLYRLLQEAKRKIMEGMNIIGTRIIKDAYFETAKEYLAEAVKIFKTLAYKGQPVFISSGSTPDWVLQDVESNNDPNKVREMLPLIDSFCSAVTQNGKEL